MNFIKNLIQKMMIYHNQMKILNFIYHLNYRKMMMKIQKNLQLFNLKIVKANHLHNLQLNRLLIHNLKNLVFSLQNHIKLSIPKHQKNLSFQSYQKKVKFEKKPEEAKN